MSPWLSATVPDPAFRRFPAVAPSGMPSPPSRWGYGASWMAHPGMRRRLMLARRRAAQRDSLCYLDAMQVTVATAKTTVRDERGREAEGLILTCSRCGETVEVYGTGSRGREINPPGSW